jgi:putative salt-induced outer membrane protein
MKIFIFILCFLLQSTAFAKLSNETELGLTSTNGNSKNHSYTVKQENDYKWEKNVLGFKLRYLDASADGEQTARFFMTGLRLDQSASAKLSFFIGETYEKDRFASIEKRLITDLGSKYKFISSEKTKLLSEFGYRYMDEERIDRSNVYSHYLRAFSEWERNWKPNFSTKLWAEYLPNLSDSEDWQFNSELSLTANLNNIFSLKTGILMRYDDLPAPGVFHKTDTLFTTSLIAKF